MEERTYGRTAPTFVLPSDHLTTLPSLTESWMFDEAAASARLPIEGETAVTSVRFARIPQDRAEAFKERLTELLDEFVAERRAGDVVYGLLVSLFPTDRPHLGATDGTETDS